MFDLIYNFIKEALFGNTTIANETIVDNASMLITILILVFMVIILIRLVTWAFYIVKRPFTKRR